MGSGIIYDKSLEPDKLELQHCLNAVDISFKFNGFIVKVIDMPWSNLSFNPTDIR